MPRPLTEKTVARFCELIALGLRRDEASRAVDISPRSGDRILSDPAQQARIQSLREREPDTGQAVRQVVRDLLKGSPQERTKGAELLLRYPDAFAALDDDPVEDDLPEGCSIAILYPRSEPDDEPDEPEPRERQASDVERYLNREN